MSNADTIASMLRAIARESEAVYATSRELLIARAAGRSIEHVMATGELSHSCNLLMSRIATLQKIVLEHDQDIAGIEVGSLAELGLRAQTAAILLLLDELCDAMQYRASSYQELFTGRLHAIEDVVSFLFDSLARINRLWLCHRTRSRALTAATPRVVEVTRPFLYRSAIRRAQRGIAELATDPDLAHFLLAGTHRADAPRVRRACAQIVDVLDVALTREPDPTLFLAAAVLEPEELYDLTDDSGTSPQVHGGSDETAHPTRHGRPQP
jgi:hypothetical protein